LLNRVILFKQITSTFPGVFVYKEFYFRLPRPLVSMQLT